MPYFAVEPALVTITTKNTWIDIDLNDYATLPPAGVSGVSLRIYAPADVNVGTRKKGCTENLYGVCGYGEQGSAWVGVNASQIFQVYAGSTSTVLIYIVGYMTEGFVFFDATTDKHSGKTYAWADIDCSAEVPDTATALIFYMTGGATATTIYKLGLRCDGSTDDLKGSGVGTRYITAVMKCASRIVEHYATTTTYHKVRLAGYITAASLGTFYSDKAGNDRSLASTGSYTDLTALSAGMSLGLYEMLDNTSSSSTLYSHDIRPKGSTFEFYYDAAHMWHVVPGDSNRLVEGKIENVLTDFYLIGYFAAPSTNVGRGGVGMGDCMII